MKESYFLFCVALSVWPVLVWCCQRYADRSDDPFGVLALLVLLLCVVLRRNRRKFVTSNISVPAGRQQIDLPILFALTAYVISIPFASKLAQAVIGITLIGLAVGKSSRLGPPVIGDWLLIYLTLPVVASLNFYLGYPLRATLTQLAAAMLRFEGFQVGAQGTMLLWNSQFVEVDAPCSGLKMLWLAIFMAASFSAFHRFTWGKATMLLTISVAGAFLTNVLRVTSLFFIENRIIDCGQNHALIHQGVGASIFALLLAIVVFADFKLASRPNSDTVFNTACQLDAEAGNKITIRHLKLSFLVLCAVAILLPLMPFNSVQHSHIASLSFKEWPTEFEGNNLKPLADTETLREFSRGFPGKIAMFTDGQRTICLRWITNETRQLHPSADCYKGLGYDISFDPSTEDSAGNRWKRITARRGDTKLHIRERIYDENGQTWNDVSAWYWAALTQKSRAPWWSVTVISR